MPRARIDLVNEVLRILGVWQSGQEPAAEDADQVDDKIDGILARLSRTSVLYVPDVEAIDEEYFRPLAVIIAGSSDIGTPPDTASVLYNEKLLQRMQKEPSPNEPIRACYF